MNGKSLDITENKLDFLKRILPETFTESRLDYEKLKATLGGDIEFREERYHLNWSGKTDVFRVLQAPTTTTLRPCREESLDFDTSNNVFIEGENLEVLKILQKAYFGKVKMIYIDPPYNTGTDSFIYSDRFAESKDAYLKRVGDKDEMGHLIREGMFRKNNRENGHFHSNWLNMIYPRLFMARNLLRDDGMIFVSIDDNEVHNLRMVMNEIFGEDNFVGQFTWETKRAARGVPPTNLLMHNHEYIVCFSKRYECARFNGIERDTSDFSNRDNDPRGLWRSESIKATGKQNNFFDIVDEKTGNVFRGNWAFSEDSIKRMIRDDLIIFPSNKQGIPRQKKFFDSYTNETKAFVTSLGWNSTENSTKDLMRLFDGIKVFDHPKPIKLITFLINQIANESDLIIDFFSGSATTAHAILKLNNEDGGNRRFIQIQLPELTGKNDEAYKAGFRNVAAIGKERIRRVVKKMKEDDPVKANDMDLGFKVFKLHESNFRTWRGEHILNEKELEKQLKIHINPLIENADTEHVLYELLLKSGLPLTSKIEDKGNWFLARHLGIAIAIALKSVDEVTIDAVIEANPQRFIALDYLFQNNDQLKTNASLLMEDSGIEFQTI